MANAEWSSGCHTPCEAVISPETYGKRRLPKKTILSEIQLHLRSSDEGGRPA